MSQPPSFERVLGRTDLLLFSVSAILTIDTLASAASMGASWFTWWLYVMVAFFIPYGLITAELGAAWPGEGGIYVWVREAFGPRWGSLAAWLYWINNAYWVASVYMVFAGTFHSIFLKGVLPEALREGAGSTWLQAGIAIAVTWLTVLLGVVRLSVSKWVPNLGAVVKCAIFVGLGVLGLGWILAGRPPANDFSLGQFVPRFTGSLSDNLAFLPVLLYNTLGFELMSSAGEEMRDPQRDVPRVILVSGALIAVVYMLGAAGILLAVPVSELSLVTGTWDALAVLGKLWGSAGDTLVLCLGVGFLYACVANIVTWSLGVNRVIAAAAQEGTAPALLGRLHPRYNTPWVAFVVMGLVATALLLGNAAFSSNASNVFWMIFKLSGLCLLLSYLLVFPAFLVLRYRRPAQPRPYLMPGGASGAWTATILCTVAIAGSSLLFFKPSPGTADPWGEFWLLLGETVLTLVVGLALMPRRLRAAS